MPDSCFRETASVTSTTWLDRLEAALGSRIVESRSLGVGFGLNGLEVRLADSRHLAVKAREGGRNGRAGLDLEAYMLNELARLSDLPVPMSTMPTPIFS